MAIMKRAEVLGDGARALLRGHDTIPEESVWRRSVMLTMVREYDGQGVVLIQGDSGMAPIRLRADGDSCELTMNFSVGGATVVPMRVWITTTNPRPARGARGWGHRPLHRGLRHLFGWGRRKRRRDPDEHALYTHV